MKKYLIYGLAALFVLMGIEIYVQDRKINNLEDERDRYQQNTETLFNDVQTYKVRDSLSAARVGELELSIKEFERFRAEDAALIKDLTKKNRDLATLNKAQAQTIIDLRATPKDTVIVVDSIPMKAKKVQCGDEWYTFTGLITDDMFEGQLKNTDKLVLTETVRYKKILWFKTKKIKDRQLDVVSLNPHTEITDVELIKIEK